MNTHDIARGAMLCAIYGVLLQVNLFCSLSIENFVPFLFSLPLLCAAPKSSRLVLKADLFCMILLTLLLSGMTTWLMAGSMLLGAYFLGRPFCLQARSGKPPRPSEELMQRGFSACLIVQIAAAWASMTLLAGLFGYSMADDSVLFAMFSPFIRPAALLFLSAAIVGICESVVMVLLLQVVLIVMRRSRPGGLFFPMPDRMAAFAFLISAAGAVFFLYGPVLKWALVCRDLFVIAFCLLAVWMDVCGTAQLLKSHGSSSKKDALIRVLVIFCAFLPGLCLIPIVRGVVYALKRESRGAHRES